MIERRTFIGMVVGGIAGCATDAGKSSGPDASASSDAADDDTALDASPEAQVDAQAVDPCEGVDTVELYDCNAQALYLDETLGPLTGVILVDDILAGVDMTLNFWHGHGGQLHAFTLGAEQYAQLRRGERTFVTTTEVDSHQHTLFIDPVDPTYRVAGAMPVVVTVEEC